MAIGGRIFEALGLALLLLAGFFILEGLMPDSGWIHLSLGVYLVISAVIAVPGICFLLFGMSLVREAREKRRFNEEMEKVDGPGPGQ